MTTISLERILSLGKVPEWVFAAWLPESDWRKKLKNFTSGDMFNIEVKVKIGHEEPHASEQTHDPLSLE